MAGPAQPAGPAVTMETGQACQGGALAAGGARTGTWRHGWGLSDTEPPRGLTTASAGSWPVFSCSGRQTLDLPFARDKKGGAGKENWPHLRQRVL